MRSTRLIPAFASVVIALALCSCGPIGVVPMLALVGGGGGGGGGGGVPSPAPQGPTAEFEADATHGYASHTVNFTDTSDGEVDTWSWDFGDTGSSFLQHPSHVYSAAGIYTVSLSVSGPDGSDTRTKYAYIQVLGPTADIWHVDSSNTSATQDGLTWATAFGWIWDGINAASSGDIVLVADGTYKDSGNKGLHFGGKNIILKGYDLYGTGVTEIDCEDSGNAFGIDGGETSDLVITGLKIIDGAEVGGAGFTIVNSSPTIVNCTITSCRSGSGAAIYCDNAHPLIADCLIKDNDADNEGGGIFLWQGSNPTIINCSIEDNMSADIAGGIYCINSSPTIWKCTISGNIGWNGKSGICLVSSNAQMDESYITYNYAYGTQEIDAAGIYCDASNPTIVNCVIAYNEADGIGGGMLLENGSDASIISCLVLDNCADAGGGIYVDNSSPMIQSCTIQGNTSNSYGGGLSLMQDCSAIVRDCIIAENDAAGQGGGFNCWGGNGTSYTYPVIINCLIIDNYADQGGGVWTNTYADPTITNSTIAYNQANAGGGIKIIYNATCFVQNCILYGNWSPNDGHELTVGGADITIEYSCFPNDVDDIFEASGTVAIGSGCIDLDPLFESGPRGDYYLSHNGVGKQDEDSPCIDAGTGLPSDYGIAGRTTRTDGVPDAGIVDMGYHFLP